MRIDHLDLLIHLEQNALASPGSGFCPPSTTLVFMVALCNGFHNTTLNLRSRSPLAHFELIYIYNRPTAVTYTQRRSRSIRSNFIPNDCTFGLFLPAACLYILYIYMRARPRRAAPCRQRRCAPIRNGVTVKRGHHHPALRKEAQRTR